MSALAGIGFVLALSALAQVALLRKEVKELKAEVESSITQS